MNLVYDDDGEANAQPYHDGSRGPVEMVPTGPGTLADFDTELSDGEWTLRVATAFSGTILTNWCVAIFEGCSAAPPAELSCVEDGPDVVLEWINDGRYDEITVLRNGEPIAEIAGDVTTYVDEGVFPGLHDYRLLGRDAGEACSSGSAPCRVVKGMIETCESPDPFDISEATPVLLASVEVMDDVDVAEVRIEIDIGHTNRGVLEVDIDNPSGTTVRPLRPVQCPGEPSAGRLLRPRGAALRWDRLRL